MLRLSIGSQITRGTLPQNIKTQKQQVDRMLKVNIS